MTADEAARALSARLDVRDGRVRVASRVYYDTFDGRIGRARLTAFHEAGQLVLAETDGRVRASSPMARAPRRMLAGELGPGSLREALTGVIHERVLLTIARVRTRERPLDVLDDERKTVVRLCLQEPDGLAPRLQVSGVRGYGTRLARVNQLLEDELGFRPGRSLVEEAALASGTPPGGIRSKVSAPVRRGQRADAAAAGVLLALLDVVEANLDGTLRQLDTEFLHDLRVSVRRSRAILRELPGIFGEEERVAFSSELRWVQQETGPARDLDVWMLDLDSLGGLIAETYRPDLAPLRTILERRRARAHTAMNRALRSDRFASLVRDWRGFLDELVARPAFDRPDAEAPIELVAGQRIAKLYARMVKAGSRLDDASPVEDFHELRKQGKELRYVLELFGTPLFGSRATAPLITALKELQDVLGVHQDREVQVQTLRALGPEVARAPDGANALMALGMLAEKLEAQQREARASFAARFADFAAKQQRRAVERAFS